MSRTTGQWKQLLEGTTPGPWEVSRSKMLGVTGDEGDMDYLTDWEGEFSRAENAALAAAAPEAVAEVIRLRRELEAQAAAYQYMANQIEATASQAGMVGRPIMAEHYAERAKDLTRILNQEGK